MKLHNLLWHMCKQQKRVSIFCIRIFNSFSCINSKAVLYCIRKQQCGGSAGADLKSGGCHLHNGLRAVLHGILYIILPFIHGTRNEFCILFSVSVERAHCFLRCVDIDLHGVFVFTRPASGEGRSPLRLPGSQEMAVGKAAKRNEGVIW